MATGGDPKPAPVDDKTSQALVLLGWTPPGEAAIGDPLMYTYKQACVKLGVSISQLYKLMKEGEIKPIPLGPQVRRITLAEMEEYVKRKVAERDGNSSAA
jgi:excisionase family DNA binding protein